MVSNPCFKSLVVVIFFFSTNIFLTSCGLTQPSSKKEEKTCPPPKSLGGPSEVACFPNSSVTPGQQGKNCEEGGHPIGSVAVHTCQPSFAVVGQRTNLTWTCKEPGKWFMPSGYLDCEPKSQPDWRNKKLFSVGVTNLADDWFRLFPKN